VGGHQYPPGSMVLPRKNVGKEGGDDYLPAEGGARPNRRFFPSEHACLAEGGLKRD
jgi:hypothetical protein